ncbi:hypothetical protein SLEP1_g54494 [Rubroshorea leprosula]|uniref:Uncharacterized protein n=1 Tax=Rubroshorea leprosula TaxID=152421 RepID=A0AAV5MEN4_9ROSI|nr:hypothetical protein SLEP1_g54494 [Rubroshorea leprosula]
MFQFPLNDWYPVHSSWTLDANFNLVLASSFQKKAS